MPYVFKSLFNTAIIFLLSVVVVAQSGELHPGNNVIVDGVPKIPVSLASAVSNYRDSLGDLLLGWDPVRREIVMIRKRPDRWQIGTLAAAGGVPATFAHVPGGTYGTCLQPQGKSLIFNVDDTSGTEVLHRVDESSCPSLLI